ncbi:micronuclear linker histone polyprotein-like [Ornithodoros turicata]|uniref:micronuclear linker histone polyprotein-like n=1 Tax=Ornithodoros turicata TaxID=34597 RepID=UPI00313A3F2C
MEDECSSKPESPPRPSYGYRAQPQRSSAAKSQYVEDYEVKELYSREEQQSGKQRSGKGGSRYSPITAKEPKIRISDSAPGPPDRTTESQMRGARKDGDVRRKLSNAETSQSEESFDLDDVRTTLKTQEKTRTKENNLHMDRKDKTGAQEGIASQDKHKRNRDDEKRKRETEMKKPEKARKDKNGTSRKPSTGGTERRAEKGEYHGKETPDMATIYNKDIEDHRKKRSKGKRDQTTNKKKHRREGISETQNGSHEIGGGADAPQKKSRGRELRGNKTPKEVEDTPEVSEGPLETRYEDDRSSRKQSKPNQEKTSHDGMPRKESVSESTRSETSRTTELPLNKQSKKNGRRSTLAKKDTGSDEPFDTRSLANSNVPTRKTQPDSPVERSPQHTFFDDTSSAPAKFTASKEPFVKKDEPQTSLPAEKQEHAQRLKQNQEGKP